mmetsp:Transcript_25772/g.54484  ORF Transcript_25772/g.54484 Transcript_25772/m.54484 type:complete len:238 (+) Transcript_25772:141-854(+)|eukprot:CAMPEP_0183731138 /NCGR_PEP_ID=MMETSP0737-20130205/34576_1 /TAXON_ID=385413 /ORGANISM="Thalassiosira miniscula, Strain CCMP1093" /LENGTH=237 /DNA_ID=CAMNT_0025963801 /DNA_START=51 /DNA_END=764 /DNA_ORIENTATION=+
MDDTHIEIAQSNSDDSENSEIHQLRTNLIADAYKKFPTRAALEDSISDLQDKVETAANFGFDVDEKMLARAELANDEVRRLLPLRMILHKATDLTEMIGALQIQKECVMRSQNIKKAEKIQIEIDELQEQIRKEEYYLIMKHRGETRCAGCNEMFPSEKKMVGILRVKETHCGQCRNTDCGKESVIEDAVVVDVDNVKVEEDNSSAGSSISEDEKIELNAGASASCGFTRMFVQSWW